MAVEGMTYPSALKELAGKDYVFQIRFTPYNISPSTTVPLPFLQLAATISLQSCTWNVGKRQMRLNRLRLQMKLIKQNLSALKAKKKRQTPPLVIVSRPSNR
ncbi:hypothetical protein YC2023_066890 [Brassica napus]